MMRYAIVSLQERKQQLRWRKRIEEIKKGEKDTFKNYFGRYIEILEK